MSVPTIRFTAAELDDFARLSGDFNPLHTSDLYARRTPWGERVVFGVLGVIRALATLPTRAGEELASLQADFVGPMFVDTDYEVTVAWPKPTTAKIKVQDGTKVVTRVTARFRPASGTAIAARDDPRSALRADAIDRAAEDVVAGLRAAGAYATDGDRLRALQSRLDLAACGVPPTQLACLLASTYVVGMEIPGRRALFSSLSIDIEPSVAAAIDWFDAVVDEFDARFSMAQIALSLTARGTLAARCKITALVRAVLPAPVLAALAEHLPPSDALAGKVAVVTGASRGLGAVTAQALASQGCTVYATYLRSEEEMTALVASVAMASGSIVPVRGDGADPALWAGLARRIVAEHGGVDALVLSASPALRPLVLEPATATRFDRFVAESTALAVQPLAHLGASVHARRGVLVFVSSIFVSENPPGWPHYIAAKGALEALARAVAAEHPTTSVSIVRPPKLRTDMTNTPLAGDDALAPEVVAAAVARDVARFVELGPDEATAGRAHVVQLAG